MSKKQDGGPAFPTLNGTKYEAGMTLRDYFAGQWLSRVGFSPESKHEIIEIAEMAYTIADAMLEARNNNQ
jgi:hypothetical protein